MAPSLVYYLRKEPRREILSWSCLLKSFPTFTCKKVFK